VTTGLDIVTRDAGEQVRTARARDTGEEALVALYRLAQMVRMHDIENQAFARALEQTHRAVVYYCLHAGTDLVILFAERVVLIGGQLLQGSRGAYEAAAELGDHFMWCGGAELTVQRDVLPKDLKAFAESLGMALRTKKGQDFRSPTNKIRLRPVAESVRVRGLTLERLKFEQRLVRTYASAVVVMRRFFEALGAGRAVLPRRLKRIAQNLVDLSEGKAPAFLGVTEVRNANHDDAGRAVNTAILAVAAARELTSDRSQLSQIAMAALMHDVGRPRAAALLPKGGAIASRLSEHDEDRLPPGTAVVLTALGRLNEPTIARTVITFESLWLKRQASLGPLFDGELAPTLQARMIAVARRYNDLLTPEPGLPPPLPDFAVAKLASELTDETDRTVLRMLVSALGLVPRGTMVKLATGETAEVLPSTGERPAGRPRLKLVLDARGNPIQPPELLDMWIDEHVQISMVIATDGWAQALEPAEAPGTEPPQQVQTLEPVEALPPPARQSSIPPGDSLSSNPSMSLGWSKRPPAPQSGRPSQPAPVVVMAAEAPDDRTIYERNPYGAQGEDTEERTQFYRREANPALASQAGALPARATATGTLQSTPLPHVLVYMLDRGFTGSLVLHDPDGKSHVVYFEGGAPSRVRLDNPVAPLGEELMAARQIAPAAYDACAVAARQAGQRVSDFLLQQGLVSAEGLDKALRSQLLHQIEWLVKLPDETTYEFYQQFDALAGWQGDGDADCEPLNIILAANRVWRATSRIVNTLTKLADHKIVLHPSAELSDLSLTPEEATLLDMIRATPCTLLELYNQGTVSDKVVSTLLYTLLVTRQLELPGQSKEPMRSSAEGRRQPRPAPLRPPSSSRSSGQEVAPASQPRGARPAELPPVSVRTPAMHSEPSPAPRSMRVPTASSEQPPRSGRSPAHPERASSAAIPIAVEEGEPDSRASFHSLGTSPSAVLAGVEELMSSRPPAFSVPPGGGVRVQSGATGATAQGDLSSTPMVHLLIYMLDREATGTVVLREPDGAEHVLEFDRGCPIKVKPARPVALLGEMLVEAGVLAQSAVEKAVGDAALLEALLGEFLVMGEQVDRPTLEQTLREQILRKLGAVANQPFGTTYEFYKDVSLLQGWGGEGGVRIEPLRAVLATVRAWTDRNRVRGTLYKMRDRKLVLSANADVSSLISDDVALAILAAVEPGDATVLDLYRRRVAPEEEINSLVYTLAIMRFFDFSAAKGPPMGARA
jgi:HD-GYP domain-containing protein (c-di-GMP phosphodiesterase class II)